MLFRALPTLVISSLVFCLLAFTTPARAAEDKSTKAATMGKSEDKVFAEKKKEKQEREKLEHQRALERIEASNVEKDEFGPLGCFCLSVLLPPLTPVWIILMILVDGEPLPSSTVNDGLGPMLQKDGLRIDEDLDEKNRRQSEVAQAF